MSSLALPRRSFLALAGAAAGSVILVGTEATQADAAPVPSDPLFRLGVASGDPHPDGVVLWTRLAPEPLAPDGFGGMPAVRVPVEWEVATDERFRHLVRRGTAQATPEWAHSVHVEVGGLQADRVYWYRFRAHGQPSPAGRTRTAPARAARLNDVTFAFDSCHNYPDGYFTALRHLAGEDVDFVLHLGDYIYEGPSAGTIGRAHLPAAEVFSLADYRIRYGQYKLDDDLQAAHAAGPWIVAPDDHDVENNWAGDHSQPDSEPDQDPAVFRQRRAAAYQAFYENLPLRRSSMPAGTEMQVYRRLQFGDLMQLNVLDTRRYRDQQVVDQADRWNADRQILGADQEQWLLDGLGGSTARWQILGNQVFMFDADQQDGEGETYGTDPWEGYAAARQRLFDGLVERRVENFVVVSGDAHRSATSDLKLDFSDQSSRTVGTEFLGTSISSGQDGADQDRLGEIWMAENPHLRFHNAQRGYQVCQVGRGELRTDYRVVPYVSRPGAPVSTRASVYVESGRAGVAAVS